MKQKKVFSLLLTGAMMVSTVLGSTVSVFAKENANGTKIVKNSTVENRDLVKWVNPLIGTNNFKGNSEWSGTAPLVSTPFGMTNFVPQTRENRIGDISYEYKDTKFRGFFATHQPAIWMGDYGYVNVAPQVGDATPDPDGRALTFSHDDEESHPYYYKVTAGKEEGTPITSEMTATERSAIYRFTYPKGSDAKIFVESARGRGNGEITVDLEKGEIYGWNNDNMSSHLNNNPPKNLKGYFVVQFKTPVTKKGTYEDYKLSDDKTTAQGQKSGAYVHFDTSESNTVEVRIGTSFYSVDQARANIEQELGDKSFDQVKESTKQIWNDKLNAIQIDGATDDENYIFYTAMYHALLYPRTFYETVDGKDMYFSPYDDQYHEGKSYTDFSLWDTFRAQNSLLTIVAPERVDEIVNSLLQSYKEGGYMPKWPNPGYTNIMIGTHADSIVAEAMVKGFDGFDYDLAYEAVLKDAMVPQEGDGTIKWADRQEGVPYEARGGLSAYKELGYIPNGYVNENGSRTIEFAYDDWCVAQVAKIVGEDAQSKYFLNRSMNYKNMISPDTGYAMGRDVEGNFTNSGAQWTEGDNRKYTWFAPQDPQGLIDLMTEYKGADFYNTELDKAFNKENGNKPWVEQQNEPCHNYAYMFDFSGRPDLTQKYARQTLLESYFNDTSGQLGNDDCGQMSAWYVFSAMGFYPVNPASGEYMIGSPIFDKVTINNPETDAQFVITAENNDDEISEDVLGNCYIQSATLNGKELNEPVITYEQLTSDGSANFVMGDKPSDWASDYQKDAIQYQEDAEAPEDDSKPPFFGDSEVTRVNGINYAKDAKVSATDYADPSGDIDVPSKSLIDGDYDRGYASKNIKSNEDLAKSPYYLTMEWDNPLETVTSFKIWSNYKGSQNPTVMDIEIKQGTDEWKEIATDWTPEWKDETGGGHRCSATYKFETPLKDITGLRVQIKQANFEWGKIAVRELEVWEDYPEQIDYSNPTDYIANIKYNRNDLVKVLYNGEELKENTDYEFIGEDKSQIKIFADTLVKNGPDAGALLELVFDQGKSFVDTIVVWDGWKANLNSLVKKAENVNTELYTQASLEKLNSALTEAKAVLEKEPAASDEELQAASDKLQQAIKDLVMLFDGKERIEFEEANAMAAGLQIKNGDSGKIVGNSFNGAWFKYDGIKFNDFVPEKATVRYASDNSCPEDAKLEIRLDSEDGEIVSTINIPPTGDWSNYVEASTEIDAAAAEKLAGTHTIYFVLTGTGNGSIADVNWISFEKDYRANLGAEIEKAQAMLDEAQIGNEVGQYPQEAADALKAAIAKATEVYNNTELAGEDYTNAINELNQAVETFKDSVIVTVPVDKGALADVISKAEAYEEKDYTAESWKVFQAALENARSVYADDNATQEDVAKAMKTLTDAMNGLEEKPVVPEVSKDELKKLIDEVTGLDSSKYTKESWGAFEKALADAKAVLAKEDATQEEVNQVLDALTKAKAQLAPVKDEGDKPTPPEKPEVPEKPETPENTPDKGNEESLENPKENTETSDDVNTGAAVQTVGLVTALALGGAAMVYAERKRRLNQRNEK